MPSSNSDGNYTKVSQVIPVKITLESEPSKQVVPGMNAEVKIHKIKGSLNDYDLHYKLHCFSAHYCWCDQFILIRSRRKAKRQQKEQHFATRQSNQSKFKASDLDKTTDQSSQHTAREEARIDNQDNQNQVSLNKQTEGSEQDQELFNDNKDDVAFAAKNPESEEYKVNEKIKKNIKLYFW